MSELIHRISEDIIIRETYGRGHKLSLYYTDNFICATSFYCYDSDLEKYRKKYITILLKHLADPINKYLLNETVPA